MTRPIAIRQEIASDAAAIGCLITQAFAGTPHTSGTEAAIVEALREGNALTLSLVAVDGGDIVGHVAVSPVAIEGAEGRWFGLGPIAVRPDRQGRGVGAELVRHGLDGLRMIGAAGCVVLGDPRYYGLFGFARAPGLSYPGAPPRYFQALAFDGAAPRGKVAYHAAFAAAARE